MPSDIIPSSQTARFLPSLHEPHGQSLFSPYQKSKVNEKPLVTGNYDDCDDCYDGSDDDCDDCDDCSDHDRHDAESDGDGHNFQGDFQYTHQNAGHFYKMQLMQSVNFHSFSFGVLWFQKSGDFSNKGSLRPKQLRGFSLKNPSIRLQVPRPTHTTSEGSRFEKGHIIARDPKKISDHR